MNGTNRKPIRTTIRDAGDSIRRREVFVAGDGSLTGGYADDTHPDGVALGRIRATVAPTFTRAYAEHGAALYVVRSYGTPIAWAGPGESLTVPDVRYSVTTSRHQGIARRADDRCTCEACRVGAPIVAALLRRADDTDS